MRPTPFHAAIVIFLEYCVWGSLTSVILKVTKITFGADAFLLNGICSGIKGVLALIFVPVIGEISDLHGRKRLLLITVAMTCSPVPALLINYKLFFLLYMISGAFNASFSLTFAYVADCTSEKYRHISYGLISASFAASMIIAPYMGEIVEKNFGHYNLVILGMLLTIIDLLFISYVVPESLEITKKKLSWCKILNPFYIFSYIFSSQKVMFICFVTFLSSLVEYGFITSIFIYLKSVLNFTTHDVIVFIASCGIFSVCSQTILFNLLIKIHSPEMAIKISLISQAIQMTIFALFVKKQFLWVAGICGAIASIGFPCLSSIISQISSADQQGIYQGLLTGIRSLCGGIGPAIFGIAFHMYGVNLGEDVSNVTVKNFTIYKNVNRTMDETFIFPGLPYLLGTLIIALAIVIVHHKIK